MMPCSCQLACINELDVSTPRQVSLLRANYFGIGNGIGNAGSFLFFSNVTY